MLTSFFTWLRRAASRAAYFFSRHSLTILLFLAVLGWLLYQRLPLYLKDRQMIGNSAENFALTSLQKDNIRLSQFKGKKVLLNFFATWCSPCMREAEDITSIDNELGGENFQLLAISTEERAVLATFKEKYGAGYPILSDRGGKVHRLYFVEVLPTMIWIDEEGQIEDISHGQQYLLSLKVRYWVDGRLF